MSGGHFDYVQHRFHDPIYELDDLIQRAEYPEWILHKFKRTRDACELAGKMLHRVDYLVSGDDGEDTFEDLWEKEIG